MTLILAILIAVVGVLVLAVEVVAMLRDLAGGSWKPHRAVLIFILVPLASGAVVGGLVWALMVALK